jgi:hypothetical protein
MNYLTVEVDIDHGRIVPRDPGKLPESGNGLLTIFEKSPIPPDAKQRVQLPLIQGNDKQQINPSPEVLDASLWE